eukprot:TRINITY_DN19924_c0_g4_i1.p1 TRINITY_DN19924_c0_g4~~TRINITY_DN19924_c0_g4_i1.p1  ORF type:complete len:309 (-),score=66.27 TRINITY_DN19924_c0_g4_i1:189-1115(-)
MGIAWSLRRRKKTSWPIQQSRRNTNRRLNKKYSKPWFQLLLDGLQAYQAGGHTPSEKVAEAIDILTSLVDFEAFKGTMLAKKAARAAGETHLEAFKGVVSVDGVLDRTAELTAAANEQEGWQLIVEEPQCVFYTKPGPNGSTYLRYTMTADIRSEQFFDMMTDYSPESVQWRDRIRSTTILHDYGPDDKVIQQELDLPWAMRYVMSIPDKMAVRIVSRRNWPSATDYAYAAVPFDVENNVCVESMGMLKIKTGVVSPHPTNPSQCTLTGMDLADLGIIPSWGLGFMLKKMSLPMIATMVDNYKKAKHL